MTVNQFRQTDSRTWEDNTGAVITMDGNGQFWAIPAYGDPAFVAHDSFRDAVNSL